MSWFNEIKSPKLKKGRKVPSNTPSGLWQKCRACKELILTEKLLQNLSVCPRCEYHGRIGAEERIKLIVDSGSFQEFGAELYGQDPLGFHDKISYQSRLKAAEEKHGRKEGTRCGLASLDKQKFALAVMDFNFLGGSMGVVCGEKIALAFDLGLKHSCPVVVISSSGGARMQEGLLSLMQMAKVSAVRYQLAEKKIPYLSVLTDPTTGGVAASFAMQGDVILAEPNALIGFAGPRVIEQSMRQTLPEGFQRSEFLLTHGMIDRIVERKNLRSELSFFLKVLTPNV